VDDDLGLKALGVYSMPFKCGKVYTGHTVLVPLRSRITNTTITSNCNQSTGKVSNGGIEHQLGSSSSCLRNLGAVHGWEIIEIELTCSPKADQGNLFIYYLKKKGRRFFPRTR
jgi:hypothetical protein